VTGCNGRAAAPVDFGSRRRSFRNIAGCVEIECVRFQGVNEGIECRSGYPRPRPVNHVGGLDDLEIEIEMDHRSLRFAFLGCFPGCVAQLGLAFRGVPRLQCRPAGPPRHTYSVSRLSMYRLSKVTPMSTASIAACR
jgi:hypothetical protein